MGPLPLRFGPGVREEDGEVGGADPAPAHPSPPAAAPCGAPGLGGSEGAGGKGSLVEVGGGGLLALREPGVGRQDVGATGEPWSWGAAKVDRMGNV